MLHRYSILISESIESDRDKRKRLELLQSLELTLQSFLSYVQSARVRNQGADFLHLGRNESLEGKTEGIPPRRGSDHSLEQ